MTIPDLNSDSYKKSIFKKKKRSPAYRWTKIILITLVVSLSLGFLVLSTYRGNGDTMRDGLEETFGGFLGRKVHIGKLNYFSLLPEMRLDVENVHIFDKASEPKKVKDENGETKMVAPEGTPKYDMTADHIHIVMSFWDILLQRIAFRHFEIKNVYMSTEMTKSKDVMVENISFQSTEDETDTATMTANGFYGKNALRLEFGFKRDTKGESTIYHFDKSDEIPVKIGFDAYTVSGLLDITQTNHFILNNAVLSDAEEPLMNANLDIRNVDGHRNITGNIQVEDSVAKLDLDLTPSNKLDGKVDISPLKLNRLGDDTNKFKRSIDAILAVHDAFDSGDEPAEEKDKSENPFSADIAINIKDMMVNDETMGTLSLPLSITGDKISIKDGTGNINDGVLTFNSDIQNPGDGQDITMKIKLKDWNYGPLQHALNGQESVMGSATIKTDLKSKGKTTDDILGNLSGQIKFVAGEGQFQSSMLNFWGGGLVNAIIPSLDPKSETRLNCAILDMDIKDGVGDIKTMFLDTKRVTLTGNGDIDFGDNKISLLLDPKSKDTALLDVATSVLVKGPLNKPSIGIDPLSLGTKVGGIIAGIINPAFLAISMTDLGITDEHPCAGFVKGYNKQESSENDDSVDDQTPAANNEDASIDDIIIQPNDQ